jgi:hypothetical protein
VKTLTIGKVTYDINATFRAGAYAAAFGRPYTHNPHKDTTQACDEWDAGWYAVKHKLLEESYVKENYRPRESTSHQTQSQESAPAEAGADNA